MGGIFWEWEGCFIGTHSMYCNRTKKNERHENEAQKNEAEKNETHENNRDLDAMK